MIYRLRHKFFKPRMVYRLRHIEAQRKTDPNNWVCFLKTGNVLLSQAASHQVSSALRSLTSVFEMGTGVTSSLLSPHIFWVCSIAPSKLNNICLKLPSSFALPWNLWSSFRPISIGQLNVSPHLHLRPINVIVSHGSYHFWRKSILVGGFALRCFQRLSRP